MKWYLTGNQETFVNLAWNRSPDYDKVFITRRNLESYTPFRGAFNHLPNMSRFQDREQLQVSKHTKLFLSRAISGIESFHARLSARAASTREWNKGLDWSACFRPPSLHIRRKSLLFERWFDQRLSRTAELLKQFSARNSITIRSQNIEFRCSKCGRELYHFFKVL